MTNIGETRLGSPPAPVRLAPRQQLHGEDALRAMGMNEYGELYAFDDGAMPKYEMPQLPGAPVPFYGLQDVTRIELPHGVTEEEILNICRERCRSDHFILIDEYKEIPDTWVLLENAVAMRGIQLSGPLKHRLPLGRITPHKRASDLVHQSERPTGSR